MQDMVTLPPNFGVKEKVPMGTVLDILPTVRSDGYTINLLVTPTVTELLTNQVPPSIRVRQMASHCDVRDGRTLMLGGLGKAKNLIVFITPTLIDAAGNQLHTSDEQFKPNN